MELARMDNSKFIKSVHVFHRAIDVITVVLLLTGQVTIGGVFITVEGGFSLSLTGAITGGNRSIAVPDVPQANRILDAADVLAALLLILDQINVIGTFITPGRFTIVVSGPFFGEEKAVPLSPEANRFSSQFKDYLFAKCHVRPNY